MVVVGFFSVFVFNVKQEKTSQIKLDVQHYEYVLQLFYYPKYDRLKHYRCFQY